MRAVPGGVAAPGQDLEGRRVGLGQHVGLVDPGESLDGRAVEADALGEGTLELRRRDGHGLQRAEHVGEPQTDEADVALFDRAQHELFLTVHVSILPHGCFTDVATHDLWDERPVVCRRGGRREGPPGRVPGAPRVMTCRSSDGHLNLTLTCSSLPPSAVLATVIVVPEPATLVDAHGFAEVQ